MITKIKIFYRNNALWMFLAKYILISFILAIVAILIDTKFFAVLSLIPNIFLTSVELAKLILSTLAGALLTITTFTFSTIMVVLTMYSSDFSPRVVNNFLTDKISMKVLGIFIGGFFYCMLTLFSMRNSISDYSVLSATIAVVYAALCVFYFIAFIYRVSSSIQATKLIKRVYDETSEIIDRSIELQKKRKNIDTYETDIFKGKISLFSQRSGYLESIEFKKILDLLKDDSIRMIIRVDMGAFVSRNEEIASLYYHEKKIEGDLLKQMGKHFLIEDERFAENDYRFSLEKIVDIALRAISPGINDPNTAVHCIHIIGVLLAKLGTKKGRYAIFEDENSQSEIIYGNSDFDKDLYFTFYQIIHYGKEDLSIVLAIFHALKTIKLSASDDKIKGLQAFSDYLYDSCAPNFSQAMDVTLLNEAKEDWAYATTNTFEGFPDADKSFFSQN